MKIKKKRILCPNCKTGKESCAMDENSPACPYLSCYDGFDCGYYIPLSTDDDAVEVIEEIEVTEEKKKPLGFVGKIRKWLKL